MQYEESPLQALHREVKEEVNLNIKIDYCIGAW